MGFMGLLQLGLMLGWVLAACLIANRISRDMARRGRNGTM